MDDDSGSDGEGSSNLDSQELHDRARDAIPSNTRRTTDWAIQTYRRWAERRQNVPYVKLDLLGYTAEELPSLDKALFKFYGEAHTVDGPKFTPSSLQVLRAGLQRYLSEHMPDMPVMATHPAFRRSNEQFKAAKRRYALEGINRAAGVMKQPLDPADQELVRAYFATARTYEDPTMLQQYVYYMLSMTFGYRGRDVWRQLKRDAFREDRDELGRPRITLDQALIEKNYQHTGPNNTCRRVTPFTDDEEGGVFMYSTLKLYLSKLDPRQAFLQKAKTTKQMEAAPNAQAWYVNAPMGNHTIDQLMPRICAAANTSRRYTNHCVRHTLGTNMLRLGYPLAAIQARLRLRSAMTLQWYTGHRTAQELTEETRAVSRPLRGVAPPTAGAGDGAVAGPSSARQFTGSPRPAPRDEQRPRTEPEAGPRAALAAFRSPAGQPRPGQQAGPRAVRTVPAGQAQEPRPEQQTGGRAAHGAHGGIVPLQNADMTRPPLPLPVWARVGTAAPPKIYSGVFHNCTFN